MGEGGQNRTWEAADTTAAVAAKLRLQPLAVVDALAEGVAVARPLPHLAKRGLDW